MSEKVRNIETLGEMLLDVFDDLRESRISESRANALANVAMKVLNTFKLQLEYESYGDRITQIPFFQRKELTAPAEEDADPVEMFDSDSNPIIED